LNVKLFLEKVEEPRIKRKHPRIALRRRRKIAQAEWKWGTIALVPKKGDFILRLHFVSASC